MLAIHPSNSIKIALSLLIQNDGICVHLLRQPAFICTPAAAKVFSYKVPCCKDKIAWVQEDTSIKSVAARQRFYNLSRGLFISASKHEI